jgi:integrase/recombinase XerD
VFETGRPARLDNYAGLPRALEPEQLQALLASCDRASATGRRDYAVPVMLARLGLRAGEVAALRLEDVDWRAGELRITGQRPARGAAAAARGCR